MAAEILDHGTRVLTGPGAGFGSDALLLARFARPRVGEAALDLCSGCGIVALCWHDEGHRGPCAAVELDAAASALCAQAVAENGPAAAHITPVCADLRAFCQAGPERGRFDFAACNPPYFRGGPPSPDARRAAARHEGACTLDDVAACAARALRFGGRFALCHRPADLARVCAALCAAGLEPKRLAVFGGGAPRRPPRPCAGTGRSAHSRGRAVRRGAPKMRRRPRTKNMPNRRRGIDADPILWYNPYG